ncbi:lysophospholipid acyltransferase family protein [Polyangium aurulentum]|uniref:lysophospholipid acyltransferase family protein n=1 Tax=Polyangium aurulentum TaxID=2567896 RepID=UPI0010AEA867|nr:lysophospholipid acyltransferase family protein [Polyangium aurulentum]UQA61882.1 lysophospholipid acyltransferase family protein [Polyangium aurulentum]
MIPARKTRWFNAWFSGHARSRIHGTFGEVRIRGLDRARALAGEAPLLVVSNHTSWWDPLVAMHVSTHLLSTDGYALMDAKNLRRLPFFALVGGFGVDLDRPEDGASAMRYAARLLDRPGRLVWVYPQGKERPITARPLGFRPGSAEIARVARKARTLPAGLRYEFGGTERPTLWLSFGEPMPAERDTTRGREAQEAAVTDELERIERAVRGEDDQGFACVYRTPPSRVGAVLERMLAAMARPWVLREGEGPRPGLTDGRRASPP